MRINVSEEISKLCEIDKINFEYAPNFIKLFELPIENNIRIDTVCNWLHYLQTDYINIDQFLYGVYFNLANNSIYADEIKHAIKKAQWILP